MLAVARRTTTDDEKRRLIAELLRLTKRPRLLEVTIAIADDLRPWRYPPRRDFQYGDWWRAEFERGELAPWDGDTDRDLAVLATIARRGNRPLLGAPPAEVIDHVPHADLVRAMIHMIPRLVSELEHDFNEILTLVRMWHTVATGEIVRKHEAAAWALPRLPQEHRPILERARAISLGGEDDWGHVDAERARPLAAVVVREIRAAASRATGR